MWGQLMSPPTINIMDENHNGRSSTDGSWLYVCVYIYIFMGEIALESPTQMIITLLCVATNACHTVYLINAIELLL